MTTATDSLLCSAWVRWHLENDKMVSDEVCQRPAAFLLSNEPHWKDQPYCQECSDWMQVASCMWNLKLVIGGREHGNRIPGREGEADGG